MENNLQPFKACWPLAMEYNFQLNRIVKATIRTDAGDSVAVEFTYNGNLINVECETRRLSIPETTELLQWAYNLPLTFYRLSEFAALTHFFMKVSK
mgnify:CR=1 FL=1